MPASWNPDSREAQMTDTTSRWGSLEVKNCLFIKLLLNCMPLPGRIIAFNLLNPKLPKQDCLMLPEHTKWIDVSFVYKTQAKLHFIFEFKFSCFSLSSKWPNLISQDGIEKCKSLHWCCFSPTVLCLRGVYFSLHRFPRTRLPAGIPGGIRIPRAGSPGLLEGSSRVPRMKKAKRNLKSRIWNL